MESKRIRETFFDFFRGKGHSIFPSAPMVIKDDPSLMFTNAGMNQFKEFFLGHKETKNKRIADTQKCLRVSGKHNDLEEVGHDTYHHTMFEMLGNWSFGDYFKKEAIEWAFELLVDVYGLEKQRLYFTYFGGDEAEGLQADSEAQELWRNFADEKHILAGSKKDNFWEMGESGPCGPCSEIHIDLRSEEERANISGRELVNKDHPLVVEIWNLVFIQYNRLASGKLEELPQKHIDTGMGFERLCMALQGKESNYDTDVFMPLIHEIERITNKQYGINKETDIAIRVVADHLRAVSVAIAEGQIPSNVKAGYVIRRILRRAVRYTYTFLDQKEAFIYKLVPVFFSQVKEVFPEMIKQEEMVMKVMEEEESSFLRTLVQGIQKFETHIKTLETNQIEGSFAFELFDTYGFPIDLTQLLAREQNLIVDMAGFQRELQEQKNRSRKATAVETDDWKVLYDDDIEEFIGYDSLQTQIKIVKYRKVSSKNKSSYQLVFNMTPFYPESGGQMGDTGYIESNGKKYYIHDTKKENNIIVHFTEELPQDPNAIFTAVVNENQRKATAANHSATHLLHYALRKYLGEHIEQKGSMVAADRLRFDFSHFQKLTEEEIQKIEHEVNALIAINISLDEKRNIPLSEAQKMGAIALFGEKYGDLVRTVRFGDSVELCGGTHVSSTGEIRLFKIISEGGIAAGIRRIEAITSDEAIRYFYAQEQKIKQIQSMFKSVKDVVKAVEQLQQQNIELQKDVQGLQQKMVASYKEEIKAKLQQKNGIPFIAEKVEMDAAAMKDLAFSLNRDMKSVLIFLLAENKGKVNLLISVSEDLIKNKNLHAGNLIRELAKEVNGGGGGQPHFASAGGSNPAGINKAIDKLKELL
jgi:alanyl-tRNA synthetase